MDAKELEEIVRKHEMWLRYEDEGERAMLADADLAHADLHGADLRGTSFRGACLRGADLYGADLRGANLYGTDVQGAIFCGANLEGANLEGTDLRDANFEGANIEGVDFRGADLKGTDLRDADLTAIKYDVWSILSSAKDEIAGLVRALKEGKVDGSTYIGDCACLVGTVANIRGVGYDQMPSIKPDGSRPAERWFMGIRKGDTPETSQISAITLEWIEEFLERGIEQAN
jgi:alkylated DNA nucleotide flippase Atl1